MLILVNRPSCQDPHRQILVSSTSASASLSICAWRFPAFAHPMEKAPQLHHLQTQTTTTAAMLKHRRPGLSAGTTFRIDPADGLLCSGYLFSDKICLTHIFPQLPNHPFLCSSLKQLSHPWPTSSAILASGLLSHCLSCLLHVQATTEQVASKILWWQEVQVVQCMSTLFLCPFLPLPCPVMTQQFACG